MQFQISNIGDEWMDLVNEFPEFVLELSPYVNEIYSEHVLYAKSVGDLPVDISLMCNLRYGFECDIGWKGIIHEYFTQIRNLINMARDNGHDVNYKTFIFKEKFGELRDQGNFFGIDREKYWSEYVMLEITLFNKSVKVCEICGDGGDRLPRRSWYKTLCPQHAIEYDYT